MQFKSCLSKFFVKNGNNRFTKRRFDIILSWLELSWFIDIFFTDPFLPTTHSLLFALVSVFEVNSLMLSTCKAVPSVFSNCCSVCIAIVVVGHILELFDMLSLFTSRI